VVGGMTVQDHRVVLNPQRRTGTACMLLESYRRTSGFLGRAVEAACRSAFDDRY
jgi:2-phospho-L-lactate guanylyltransferase (CobY/MobA/RfbA family)